MAYRILMMLRPRVSSILGGRPLSTCKSKNMHFPAKTLTSGIKNSALKFGLRLAGGISQILFVAAEQLVEQGVQSCVLIVLIAWKGIHRHGLVAVNCRVSRYLGHCTLVILPTPASLLASFIAQEQQGSNCQHFLATEKL